MESLPPGPSHIYGRVLCETRSGVGSATGLGEHLWPERLIGTPVVHDEIVLPEQSRDPQLIATDGGAIEDQTRSCEGTEGDGELQSTLVQVHDLVPPENIVGHRHGLIADHESHDPVVVEEVARLVTRK